MEPIAFSLMDSVIKYAFESAKPVHVGSHVMIHGLVKETQLNDKNGFVISRNDNRWGVVLFQLECDPGHRKIWNIKSNNLKPTASYLTLKIPPVLRESTIASDIGMFDFKLGKDKTQNDSSIIQHIHRITGWTNVKYSYPINIYSKHSPYPDLVCFWNGDDKTSQIHPISGGLSGSIIIRGPIFLSRMCPSISCVFIATGRLNKDNISTGIAKVQDPTPYTPEIGILEMLDTLHFYQSNQGSYHSVHERRNPKRQDMFEEIAVENSLREQH